LNGAKINLNSEIEKRIKITSSCTDSDYIPKVESAGQIQKMNDGTLVQFMHNGLKVIAGGYYGEWMQKIIHNLNGHHEPQEEKVFFELMKVLKQKKIKETQLVILELGSFWSYYSLWFKSIFPYSKSILVEPDLNYLKIGEINFKINNEIGYFYNMAISELNENKILFTQESDGKKIKVEKFSLDKIFKDLEIENITLLMCDIQGHEKYFFHQIEEFIVRKKIDFMLIGTHHKSISGSWKTHENLLAYLKKLGAHIISEHSVAESFSGDGLIAVTFNPDFKFFEVQTTRARNSENIFPSLEDELERRDNGISQGVFNKDDNSRNRFLEKFKNKIQNLLEIQLN
jgi:FkbM family methyltransferase